MDIDTIITRFYKKFGPPLPRNHPLLIGSELESFGLTFDLPTCLKLMYQRIGKEIALYDAEPVNILPRLEYECRDRSDKVNILCSWSTTRLVAGLSILDSRPYSRCSIKFSTVEFPIFITRTVNKKEVTVVIAPEEWTVKPDGYPTPNDDSITQIKEFYKVNITWLDHILDTTWWMVHYNDQAGYSEYCLKCSNCGAEILPGDYRNDHPQCECWCSCESCEQIRFKKDYINNMQWYSRKKWA